MWAAAPTEMADTDAARIARLLAESGELSCLTIWTMASGRSSVVREVTVQLPRVVQHHDNPFLGGCETDHALVRVQDEIPRIISLVNCQALIAVVSRVFLVSAQLYLEGGPNFLCSQRSDFGSLVMYDLAGRKVHYGGPRAHKLTSGGSY